MANSRILSVDSKKKRHNIKNALSFAILEWLLMFLLFVDGLFSYLITKFACYCDLQTPCLLCSRLDRILGKYYWDLICSNHKSEISCLVLCHAHNKLVDVRGMCETCLFSFATINKSNAETYRLLVGKLGESSVFDMDDGPIFEEQIPKTRICSCCNSPWAPKGYQRNLLQMTLFGTKAGPLSQSHPLSHVWYKELKINSDSESEIPFSDEGEDPANSKSREFSPSLNGPIKRVQIEPRAVTTQPNDSPVEKLIDPVPDLISLDHVESSRGIEPRSIEEVVPLPLDEKRTLEKSSSESIDVEERKEPISENDGFAFQDAEEMIVEESTAEIPSSLVSREAIAEEILRSKLISEDEEIPWSDSKDTLVHTLPPSRLISLVDVLPTSSGVETPVEGLKESYVPRPEEILQAAVIDSGENCKTITTTGTITETPLETIPVSAENCQQVLNMLDLGEAYKLAVSSRGRQLSGVLADQWTGKDSSRISDDLKHLFSQFSNTREQSMNDSSPRLSLSPKHSANSERFLERNESGYSLDGSIVSEMDGETLVGRLTRQIEHDKKLLSGLYKELEEERNSSSIAVNQAMAMITRLQEEKATLQMEALQCVRMMEEQAEYDMEALQKTNDILAAREKEIQDLEDELEYYRIKYPDEYLLDESMDPLFDMKTKEIKEENKETTTSVVSKPEEDENAVSVKSLLSDIEDERLFILKSLKDLEKKLVRFPDYQLSLALNEQNPGEITENDHDQDRTAVDIAENNEMFYTPAVPNLDIIANEVYDLNERLKALEADRSFIEHSINSVQNGEEGLKFVQEIASHLRELRKVRATRSGK